MVNIKKAENEKNNHQAEIDIEKDIKGDFHNFIIKE